MTARYTRLRVRRKVRARKKQVADFGQQANKQLDRHIFRRWHNLKSASRFSIGWVGLIVLLIAGVIFQTRFLSSFYLLTTPVEGGMYSEGIVGNFTNANPIYAIDDVDTSVSKLVFSSLLTYDNSNKLVGNMAKSWKIDERGLTYEVTLKDNLIWHDGKPLTADDVIFTYKTIQNPDARSPYISSWANVNITKLNNKTVRFVLPNAYSPFLHSLTGGIIPKHVLNNIPITELRSHSFNIENPIGSGPFKFKNVDINKQNKKGNQATVQLISYDNYHLGKPKLDGITIKSYENEDALKEANKKNEVITAAGINIEDLELPKGYEIYDFHLMSANMIFFKTSSPILNNLNVRKALIHATNLESLSTDIGYPTIAVRAPILKSQIGYNDKLQQLRYDKNQAIKLLDEAGWSISGQNQQYRSKNGDALVLKFTYPHNPEFFKIVKNLQKQWAEIGVNLSTQVTPERQVNRRILDSHDYDVLLYGINIGADPDVYAYWHSSQIDPKRKIHLNLSEYKSSIADAALEAGRSRQSDEVRAAKYKTFLEAWRKDVPAIGLYQPRYVYLLNQQHIYGLENKYLNNSSDRFNNVHNWMIKTKRTF